jgi:hypothetical protein
MDEIRTKEKKKITNKEEEHVHEDIAEEGKSKKQLLINHQ